MEYFFIKLVSHVRGARNVKFMSLRRHRNLHLPFSKSSVPSASNKDLPDLGGSFDIVLPRLGTSGSSPPSFRIFARLLDLRRSFRISASASRSSLRLPDRFPQQGNTYNFIIIIPVTVKCYLPPPSLGIS